MGRVRDAQEHAGHTYEDQALSEDWDPEYDQEAIDAEEEHEQNKNEDTFS